MQRDRVRVLVEEQRDDDVRWLALTIARGLKLIVREIEKRYQTGDHRAN